MLCAVGVRFFCQEVPSEGPSAVPLTRPLMTISRVYINPNTGVGPEPASLAPFNTLQLTPKDAARDTRQAAAGQEATGARPVPGTASRANSSRSSSNDNSTASAGELPAAAVVRAQLAVAAAHVQQKNPSSQSPTDVQRPLLLRSTTSPQSIWRAGKLPSELLDLAAAYTPPACSTSGPEQTLAGSSTNGPGTANQGSLDDPCVRSFVGMSQCTLKGSADVCCAFVQSWSSSGCWCRGSGQQLLDSMPLSMTPMLLQLLGWVCE